MNGPGGWETPGPPSVKTYHGVVGDFDAEVSIAVPVLEDHSDLQTASVRPSVLAALAC